MRQSCQLTVLLLASVVMSASTVFAQPATAQTFEQLQVLVSIGDAVKVIDRDGNRVAGRIADVSGSRLVLDVNGTKRTVNEGDAREVRRRGGDSLANGAWLGFGVGAGFGGLVVAALCQTEPCSGAVSLIIPVYGALGAGIGVGFDALIRGERALYRAPGRLAMSVTPIFGTRTGIGVSVAF